MKLRDDADCCEARGNTIFELASASQENEGLSAQDPNSVSVVHIINDLTQDTRFCDRSYVKDGPKARFYAGVPICTSRGINIGALCVLDENPRDGLEPGQMEFLQSMASAVMSHLELVSSNRQELAVRDGVS